MEEQVSAETGDFDDDLDWRTEILDFLMFFGLTTNIASLWSFPAKAMTFGGIYFVILYILTLLLVAIPLIHFEILIGQRQRAGACKLFSNYGLGYEGIGATLFFVTFLIAAYFINDTYEDIIHISNIIANVTDIVTCDNGDYDWRNCSSLFDSVVMGCRQGKRRLTALSPTTPDNQYCSDIAASAVISSAEKYSSSLTHLQHGNDVFDVQRLLFYLIMFTVYAFIAIAGIWVVKFSLAYTYIATVLFLLVSVFLAISMAGIGLVWDTLWTLTNPEALNTSQAWTEAIELGITTSGVIVWGVMAAATLRERKGGSYELAVAVVLNNIIIALLSFLFTISISAYIADTDIVYYYQFETSDTGFYFGAVTDVLISDGFSFLWVLICSIPCLVAKITRFFPPILMLCAIFNEKGATSGDLSRTSAIIITCLSGFVLNAFASYQPLLPYLTGISPTLRAHFHFLVGVTLIVCYHGYGSLEYLIDVAEEYDEEGTFSIFGPVNRVFLLLYDIAPFIALVNGLVELVDSVKEANERNRLSTYITAVTPFIIFLVYFFINASKVNRQKEWTWLFSPTPDHPSYDRIHELDSYEKDFPTQETPMLEQKSSEGMVAAKTTPSTGTLSKESAEPILRKSKLPTRRIKQSAEALLRTKEALRRSKEAKQKKFGEEQGTQSERSRQKPVGAVAVGDSKEKGGLSKEGKEAPTQKTVSSKEGGVEQNRIPEIPTPALEEDKGAPHSGEAIPKKGVSYSGEAIPKKGVSYSGEAIPKKGLSYSGEEIPKKGVVGSSNENPMVMAGDKNRASKELRGSVELWPRK